ncbi:FkbM family methyltransferase [SAR92 clade bacterium H231]|nr:FkbM family methyltransferase [SAR92 clade bacterium H231]
MLKKIRKVARLIQLRLKFKDVIYYGAPSFVRFLGISRRKIRKGFYSQVGQDELIFTEFFKGIDSKDFPKLFIDVGCNHPFKHSNSYFYEMHQGFKVLAIDALRESGNLWRTHRPEAEFVECAVGSSDGEVSFDVIEGEGIDSMFSSVSGASEKKKVSIAATTTIRTVKVRRISDILAERDIHRAGIVSMDVEGYELHALRGIDFNDFFSYVFIIENNGELELGNNQIRDLMISNGYIYFARVWNMDDIFIHPEFFTLGE